MSILKKSSCHCGAVELRLKFVAGLQNIRRCSCTLCSRKGYIMASVAVENLSVVMGAEFLSLYQFGSKVAEHYFCSQCGIHTHHKRRSNPNEYGVNIACIDGVDALSFENVPTGNGGLNAPLADD